MKCKECEYEIDSNSEYCPKCGVHIYSSGKDRRNRKNRDNDDDEEGGGFLESIGNIIGKIFGG